MRHDLEFDQHQFFRRPNVVSKKTRLSFQDAEATHIFRRSPNAGKQTPAPRWVFDKVLLQEVVLNYLEQRYFINRPSGTPNERLAAVRAKLVDYILPEKFALQRLMNRYATATSKEKARLAIQIQNSDTDIMCMTRGVDKIVVAVVYHYYLLHENSVEVAEELGLRPPHVRQLISRLHQAWFRISGERNASRYAPGGTCFGRMLRRWTAEDLRKMFVMRASGMTFTQIGKVFGLTESVAGQVYRRYFRTVPTFKKSRRRVCMSRSDQGLRVRYELL